MRQRGLPPVPTSSSPTRRRPAQLPRALEAPETWPIGDKINHRAVTHGEPGVRIRKLRSGNGHHAYRSG